MAETERYRTAPELLLAALDCDGSSGWADCQECHCEQCRARHPHDCEVMMAIAPALEAQRRKAARKRRKR